MKTEGDSGVKKVILALTGASGAVYGLTLAGLLIKQNCRVHFICSPTAEEVVVMETGRDIQSWTGQLAASGPGTLTRWNADDYRAPAASGSSDSDGMVIAPCSMGTLGRIASGISSSLIERAADVCLKERRPLVLMCRETPLSAVHLENMLTLTRAGAVIMPPVPAFYTKPETIEDLVLHTCDRVLSQLGLRRDEAYSWGSEID